MNNDEFSIYDICIDKLILSCPTDVKFKSYNEITKLNDDRFKNAKFRKEVEEFMIDLGYLDLMQGGQLVKITSHGRNVRRLGGHMKYLEQEGQLEQAKKEKEEIEGKNTILSLQNNYWQYKTRWWPHIIAVIAVLISIWALLEDEVNKEKLKEEIIKELQQKKLPKKGQ